MTPKQISISIKLQSISAEISEAAEHPEKVDLKKTLLDLREVKNTLDFYLENRVKEI